MAKYEVLRDCYGFQGKHWQKGDIVEIDPKEKPPHHFKQIGKGAPASTVARNQNQQPARTNAEVARNELLIEAKARGIQEADILNEKELLEVLAKDVSPEKIAAIIKKAKKRQQK